MQNFIYGFHGAYVPTKLYNNEEAILKDFDGQYERVSFLKQVHGNACLELKSGADINFLKEADAQVTRNTKIILAVSTADCVPILLADPINKVIGAAHAGWKGALSGVVNSVVKAMQQAGAESSRTMAIIGPCIRQNSYEVSEDFVSRFLQNSSSNAKFFKPSSTKALFDLPGYVTELLYGAGIQNVQDDGIDTLEDYGFFSYRRATKAKEKLAGHNISFIALKP